MAPKENEMLGSRGITLSPRAWGRFLAERGGEKKKSTGERHYSKHFPTERKRQLGGGRKFPLGGGTHGKKTVYYIERKY